MMDNLRSHKGQPVRAAIRAVGAKLFFLPPYSPDLNPIEQAFSKLKTQGAKPPREPRYRHMAAHRQLDEFIPSRMQQLFAKLRIRRCYMILTRSNPTPTGRRARSAAASVPSSSTSSAPPIGTPCPTRLTVTPSGFSLSVSQ